MKIAIIGGGAAGFFSAISCKTHHPAYEITIYEKTHKLLSKVKISGGGRCNVTHACFQHSQLAKYYPRGANQLKKAFDQFDVNNTFDWFESRDVKLKTEEDNRVFPITDNSQTIINCLLQEVDRLGIVIKTGYSVSKITADRKKYDLHFANDSSVTADKVIVATGGSPKLAGLQWLATLGHQIVVPVPSLFTFNMPSETITKLMGVVAQHVTIRVQGTKLIQQGPLLITHWGMSGPAILKLSAWGARFFAEKQYQFTIQVNWLGDGNENAFRTAFDTTVAPIKKRKVVNKNPFQLSSRLWQYLVERSGIDTEITWTALNKKHKNKLINTLFNDVYHVNGKTTFKEEFVTCGGVDLQDIDIQTMESKRCPGMYFSGEVMDIDGITGGFNFQAAWTTGFIAGKLKNRPNG